MLFDLQGINDMFPIESKRVHLGVTHFDSSTTYMVQRMSAVLIANFCQLEAKYSYARIRT